MRRCLAPRSLFAVAVFAAVAAVSTTPAAPAVAQSRPAACAARNDVPSLAGSRWAGRFLWEDSTFEVTAYFRPDCVFEYRYNDVTYTNGRWLQRNELVVWDTNDFFAVFTGRVDSRTMSGRMLNEGGVSGTWSLRRTD